MSGSAANRYERAKRRQGSGNVPGDELAPRSWSPPRADPAPRGALRRAGPAPRGAALGRAEVAPADRPVPVAPGGRGGPHRPGAPGRVRLAAAGGDTGDLERLDFDLAAAAYCLRVADLEPDLAAELEGRADAAIDAAERYDP